MAGFSFCLTDWLLWEVVLISSYYFDIFPMVLGAPGNVVWILMKPSHLYVLFSFKEVFSKINAWGRWNWGGKTLRNWKPMNVNLNSGLSKASFDRHICFIDSTNKLYGKTDVWLQRLLATFLSTITLRNNWQFLYFALLDIFLAF